MDAPMSLHTDVVEKVAAEAMKLPEGVSSSLIDFLKANAPWLGKAMVDGVIAALEAKFPEAKAVLEEIKALIDAQLGS